jgi:MoaA/NifB/PqqE/SkfB family radical SAM enzyme
MNSTFHKPTLEHTYNFLANALQRKFSENLFFRSLLTTFYITLRCNLRCTYCDYYCRNVKELSTEDTLTLLEKIRPGNPGLDITGGEPLVRADTIEILKKAKELKFDPVVLNTNGMLLHKREECLRYVDYLIVSLYCMDEEKWDSVLGVTGAAEIIIANIKKYSQLQEKYDFKLTINAVITPATITDMYGVIEFCNNYKIPMSPVPQDNGSGPDPDLANDPEYYALIEHIFKMKSQGYRIVASNMYLNQIRTFPEHNCFPSLVPRIFPDGSVLYPCQPLEKVYGNLLDYPNLYEMLREAYAKNELPSCTFNSKKCFLSCYMEFTNLVECPLSICSEYLL